MILQKQKAYVYKGETKYKYIIVVPESDVIQLGWKSGDKIEGTVVQKKGYFLSKLDNK